MFLLVPAYPGCPGQTAVKWLLLLYVRERVKEAIYNNNNIIIIINRFV